MSTFNVVLMAKSISQLELVTAAMNKCYDNVSICYWQDTKKPTSKLLCKQHSLGFTLHPLLHFQPCVALLDLHLDSQKIYRIVGNFRGTIFSCFSANERFRGNIFVVAVCTLFYEWVWLRYSCLKFSCTGFKLRINIALQKLPAIR